jgi:long-chain fatty acid transport protein
MLSMPALAIGGGLMRPNPVSARSIGLGGAFTAVADDPTALHFNPAGLSALPGSNVLIGVELVHAPRFYQPVFADDRCSASPPPAECQRQEPGAPIRPLPSLGFATRLEREGVPSRLTFGVGLWNTFGGQLKYDDNPEIPGTLIETRNAVIEIVPGASYEVNDVLAVGFAFRLGFGLFDSVSVQRPSDADLSATGLGAGATFGVMVKPSNKLRLGFVYRTPLTVTTKGDGVLNVGGMDRDVKLEYVQRWPQQMGFGAAFTPNEKLLVSVQLDWHGWQRVNDLGPVIEGEENVTRLANIDTDWQDNYAFHLGAQYNVSDKLHARGGFTYDTRAAIKKSQERTFLDSNKMLAAVGASYRINDRWRIDTAFERTIPRGETVIEDNSAEASMANWSEAANVSPGEHGGTLTTFELAVQLLF